MLGFHLEAPCIHSLVKNSLPWEYQAGEKGGVLTLLMTLPGTDILGL